MAERTAYSSGTQRLPKTDHMGKRRCSLCGEYKLPIQFVTGNNSQTHCKVCRNLRQRLRRVGMTKAQYEEMVEVQGGKCALCNNGAIETIDHCHESSRVRGLVCNPCNLLLGWVEKIGVDILPKVEEYLGYLPRS